MPKKPVVDTAGVAIDGAKLRIRRQLSGQTLAGFAQLCDATESYISHIERGVRRPSPPMYVRICNALDIPEGKRHTLLKAATQRRNKAAA